MNALVDALSEYGIRHIDMPDPGTGLARDPRSPQTLRTRTNAGCLARALPASPRPGMTLVHEL
jgi:hypothetical protein